MSSGLDKMCREAVHEVSVRTALRLLADGFPYEKVVKYTNLSIEEVRELAEKKSG